jgi:hypothetical protein
MELRETTIDRLRKWLGRDPTEKEIKAERDRKWRFALADMGITAECFLDESRRQRVCRRGVAATALLADLPHGWQPPAHSMRATRTQRVWHRRTNVWR